MKDGKLVYTCGKKGGRPIRGAFDEQAMMRMSAVAVDAKGQVWVTEQWEFRLRVSVWGRDGKLVRDFIGPAGHAGAATYLHDQDSSLAYSGPVEMRLDRKNRSAKVTRVLWVPDASKGERFFVSGFSTRFRKEVGGVLHEYLYSHDEGESHVVFMEFPDGWRPVAAVCTIGKMLGLVKRRVPSAMPSGECAGLDPADVCFWSDANRDGIPQRSECLIVPATKKSEVGKSYSANIPLRLSSGWGGRIGPDFSLYALPRYPYKIESSVVRYKATKISGDGVPSYGPEGEESREGWRTGATEAKNRHPSATHIAA